MNKPQKDRSSGITFPFQDAFKYFMIDPRTNWQRFYNPQFYINYNAGDVCESRKKPGAGHREENETLNELLLREKR